MSKPFSEFYTNKGMADGHNAWCIECRKIYMVAYRKSAAGKLSNIKTAHMQARKNPQRAKAEWALNHAVRSGRVAKANKCCFCGSAHKIEGHHYDYSLPLDVIWLCHKCHRKYYHNKRMSHILYNAQKLMNMRMEPALCV
jgi:hypothetical protein